MTLEEQQDPVLNGLNAYVVGGAVRDALMGLPCGDRDWVVVGATPEQMLQRGFIPVGADFPVFLHPSSKEEYALARTERKSGKGYKGFTFYTGLEVTLEQDLARRDLTINAMAQAPDGRIIDPYGGLADLQQKRLRHVGAAFAEDPVRVLRLARFAARFTQFTVDPDTVALCRKMVEQGEVDHLVPERVWQELTRGLMSEQPSRMFCVLQQCGALNVILPGFVFDDALAAQVDQVRAQLTPELALMYALAMHRSPARQALATRLRATAECAQWAQLFPVVLEAVAQAHGLPSEQRAAAMYDLIESADGLRRQQRLQSLLMLATWLQAQSPQPWLSALHAANSVDAGAIARPLASQGATAISSAVRAARLLAVVHSQS